MDRRKAGSSPLTRGKRAGVDPKEASEGLIPAHAGKTLISNGEIPKGRAHPRSRGENRFIWQIIILRLGSSPLTRGKHLSRGGAARLRGLIPAHAGKTRCPTSRFSPRRAHPRSRGENTQIRPSMTSPTGSSPLTRGKRDGWPVQSVVDGLIPAHAGKTQASARVALTVRAHPRSRGENARFILPASSAGGSSPLTRGKHAPTSPSSAHHRLIPAHAGKTRSRKPSKTILRAHPRSRGENSEGFGDVLEGEGSSPLTRGKQSAVVLK